MATLKAYKKHLGTLKWAVLFIKLFIFRSDFRNCVAVNSIHERSVEEVLSCIRRLLQLRPSWMLGHYYYALASFRKFQCTKVPQAKGALRLSATALEQLHAPPHIARLSRVFLEFIMKNYDFVIKELESLREVTENERYMKNLVLELLGASYLVTDTKEKALTYLEEIKESDRNQEVSGMIHLIQSSRGLS